MTVKEYRLKYEVGIDKINKYIAVQDIYIKQSRVMKLRYMVTKWLITDAINFDKHEYFENKLIKIQRKYDEQLKELDLWN